mmetsp:Transcript_127518/g.254775  ORF Transcript_127518/g.254775 Transcript_127518/m.254775 type:complete len:293 (-) Transcript_127518:319-1197(-)
MLELVSMMHGTLLQEQQSLVMPRNQFHSTINLGLHCSDVFLVVINQAPQPEHLIVDVADTCLFPVVVFLAKFSLHFIKVEGLKVNHCLHSLDPGRMALLHGIHRILSARQLVNNSLEWTHRLICGPQVICMSVQPIYGLSKHGRQVRYSFINALKVFRVFVIFLFCCLNENLELLVRIFAETFHGYELLCGGLYCRIMFRQLTRVLHKRNIDRVFNVTLRGLQRIIGFVEVHHSPIELCLQFLQVCYGIDKPNTDLCKIRFCFLVVCFQQRLLGITSFKASLCLGRKGMGLI